MPNKGEIYMKNLKEISGLPISLDDQGMLVFGQGLDPVVPSTRSLEDMRKVLLTRSAQGPEILYHMYRDVHFKENEDIIRKHKLRYDITVIKPGLLGKEFIKTAGHYHPLKEGQNMSYPEVYEVLSGKATYILQKRGQAINELDDVIALEVEAGEKVCIPPDYGHVTVNAEDETLVMANWVGDGWSSLYEGITNFQGAACYKVEELGDKKYKQNDRCIIRKLRRMVAIDVDDFGLIKGQPMYESCMKDPDKFRFLTEPQDYMDVFDGVMGEYREEI